MELPKDPAILLSLVNMKLRDFYGSLQELCRAEDLPQEEIEDKLKVLHYVYTPERNQFVYRA